MLNVSLSVSPRVDDPTYRGADFDQVAEAYADSGADLIELGVPYSDPLADGPVIHAAATRALAAGAGLDDVLGICSIVAERLPVLPMVYANMALARGAEPFADALLAAGACGAIIPDLPPGEDESLPAALAERDLALIPFVSPTTPPDRRRRLLAGAGDADERHHPLRGENPVDHPVDYNRMFGELVALEQHRRTLRERAVGPQ